MSKTYNVYMLVASGFECEEAARAFIDSDPDFSDRERDLMRVVEGN